MKHKILLFCFISSCLFLYYHLKNNDKIKNEVNMANVITAPVVKIKEHSFNINGNLIQDNYNWMRDPKWPKVEDKEILDHLDAENKYTKSHLSKLDNLKEEIFQEFKGRIELKDQSVPVKRDNYLYYSRIEETSEYAVYCRKKSDDANSAEEITLDIPKLAEGKAFFNVGSVSVSENHKLIAYSVDETGSERYVVKIKNLETGGYLHDEIENVMGSITWHKNDNGFFYTPSDENWRHLKLFYHKLGDDPKNDIIIYEEHDPLFSVSASKSSSRDYLIIQISGHGSSESRIIDFSSSDMTPKLVKAREDKIFYDIDHHSEYFYIHSNDMGKNFRLARASISSLDEWEDFIPHREDSYLNSFNITKDYLLLNRRENASPTLEVIEFSSMNKKIPKFDMSAYEASIYSTNFEENDIRLNCSSLVQPNSVYSYDYVSEERSLLKMQKIPTGFDADLYDVERIFVPHDEVLVPVTLFYRKDKFNKDGTNPLYLYGYGSYGIRIPVSFRTTALSLVDRGVVFAIAHIRGGDDRGFDWYESAKFLNKKRTFNDYIAIADHLVEQKYTSSGNIITAGGSAGGMLVGTVVNMRPELFKIAVAHVPFVDVLNTMLDEELPLTPGEFKEWGNPKEQEYFDYIKSYSPYDNVIAQNYPIMFVTAGLSDPRVGYWEAAKWVAKLRELKTDSNIILLKTNMEYGHRGASGRFSHLYDTAEEFAFIINLLVEHHNHAAPS